MVRDVVPLPPITCISKPELAALCRWSATGNDMRDVWSVYTPQTSEETAVVEEAGYEDKRAGIYLLKEYACPVFVVIGERAEGEQLLLRKLVEALPGAEQNREPDMNLLARMDNHHPAHPGFFGYFGVPSCKASSRLLFCRRR